jgi:hypothetical protein
MPKTLKLRKASPEAAYLVADGINPKEAEELGLIVVEIAHGKPVYGRYEQPEE